MSNTPPSKVICVRGIPLDCTNDQLTQLFRQFGRVAYVICMAKKSQALIEFDSIESAQIAIAHSAQTPLMLGYSPLQVIFSTNEALSRRAGASGTGTEKILLITIMNPIHLITCDTMQQVCSPYGKILRIVLMNKNGLQALVEYDSHEAAQAAKEHLEGKDIYEKCCTMLISYSTLEHLTVKTNSDRSRDFTRPDLPTSTASLPVLPNMQNQAMSGMMGGNMGGMGAMGGMEEAVAGASKVIIAHNLAESMGCDHVFNLFCIYGNIVRIRLMFNKKGTAMIEFEDLQSATLALTCLTGAALYGKSLDIRFSKHPSIAAPKESEVEQREDGSVFIRAKSYTSSPLNRYGRPGVPGLQKHGFPPSKTVHFHNVPPTVNEESLQQILTQLGAQAPSQVRFFPPKRATGDPTTKKRSGLMEWDTVQAATEALVAGNNAPVYESILKMHFSNRSLTGETTSTPDLAAVIAAQAAGAKRLYSNISHMGNANYSPLGMGMGAEMMYGGGNYAYQQQLGSMGMGGMGMGGYHDPNKRPRR